MVEHVLCPELSVYMVQGDRIEYLCCPGLSEVWYIDTIIRVFSESAHNMDLCAMLRRVSNKNKHYLTNILTKTVYPCNTRVTRGWLWGSMPLPNTEICPPKMKTLHSQKGYAIAK